VRVEVEEGRVEVWGGGDRALLLSAGEAARVDSDSGALHRDVVEPGRIASWRSGGLTMVDESLSAILAELGLRFGVGIELSDPAAGAARLNVYYPGLETLESLESVLADLATQQDLRYRRTNDGWELF
jgi:ferric-dicitrate binding protein FerR (iron transport regulator)